MASSGNDPIFVSQVLDKTDKQVKQGRYTPGDCLRAFFSDNAYIKSLNTSATPGKLNEIGRLVLDHLNQHRSYYFTESNLLCFIEQIDREHFS